MAVVHRAVIVPKLLLEAGANPEATDNVSATLRMGGYYFLFKIQWCRIDFVFYMTAEACTPVASSILLFFSRTTPTPVLVDDRWLIAWAHPSHAGLGAWSYPRSEATFIDGGTSGSS